MTLKVLSFENEDLKLNADSILAYDIVISFIKNRSGILMTNEWKNKKSSSFGKITRLKLLNYSHSTDTTFASKEYSFVWHYQNSYNKDTGKCLGKIKLVFLLGKPEFTLALFVLKGYNPIIIKGIMK
jgi:hypothetical protein